MDLKKYKSFSSKILLFGEYIVLQGGQSLSFPFDKYGLQRSANYHPKNQYFFRKLFEYIMKHDVLRSRIHSDLESEIHKGLHFESNIPIGYGLGSSGALVAAIYDEFFTVKSSELNSLKEDLALLESFFHTKSSGIDPLTSYLNKPILSNSDGIHLLSDQNIDLGKFILFDSGLKRSAKEAIQHFNILTQDFSFKTKLCELADLSNIMVRKWIEKKNIDDEIKRYSELQLIHFKDFIPNSVKTEWEKGLDSGQFYMKLCGAGMGGMYLKYQLTE